MTWMSHRRCKRVSSRATSSDSVDDLVRSFCLADLTTMADLTLAEGG
jgi:hypothetical protein